MFVNSLCQAVANLLEIQIAQSTCNFLRVKTVTSVPSNITLILLDQGVPLFFLDTRSSLRSWRELLVKECSFGSHGPLFLSLVGLQVLLLGLGLLGRGSRLVRLHRGP
jgi:hypothetical protein